MYNLRKYRFKDDGLNKLQYDVINVRLHSLFTWIHVRYNETLVSINVVSDSAQYWYEKSTNIRKVQASDNLDVNGTCLKFMNLMNE